MAHEELLARTDFFADAPPSVVRDLAAIGSELHLIRGDVLFREGDIADSVYLVVSGRVAIAIANPIDHRETVVALMDGGDLFGEMSMLDEGPRSALARALEPSVVLAIPFDPVVKAFRSDPTLLWAVTRLLAQRLRVMDEALADSVFLDVTGRPDRARSADAVALALAASTRGGRDIAFCEDLVRMSLVGFWQAESERAAEESRGALVVTPQQAAIEAEHRRRAR